MKRKSPIGAALLSFSNAAPLGLNSVWAIGRPTAYAVGYNYVVPTALWLAG
jgi:hypothetical protein